MDPKIWGTKHNRGRFILCVIGVMHATAYGGCTTPQKRIGSFCRMAGLGCTEQEACVFATTFFGGAANFLEAESLGTLDAAKTPLGVGHSSGQCQADLIP